jgi:hypothetical protein
MLHPNFFLSQKPNFDIWKGRICRWFSTGERRKHSSTSSVPKPKKNLQQVLWVFSPEL